MLRFYNTYKKSAEEFRSSEKNKVKLYTCGPTVYDYAHIGNMRYFIFQDVLRRSLEFLGFKVKHVMNITDVGHLTSDEDAGEDKLEKGAKRENRTVWEVAKFYTDKFLEDAEKLNIDKPSKLVPATKVIKPIIEIVEVLMQKGFAYETSSAVYFDISKFPEYENITGQKLSDKMQAAREEIVIDEEKKHPADFALWFKTVGRFQNHVMRWDSPWGEGFPGWHIECSAIAHDALGEPLDIHTGGVDHIQVHHANEIAQSQAAFDRPLANFWLHSEHMLIEGQKISKSAGNFLTLDDLSKQGFFSLDFRYLVLTSHYRNKINFTWEGLEAAHRAYKNLRMEVEDYAEAKNPDKQILGRFTSAIENDLDTATALTVLWDVVRNASMDTGVKRATINEMDAVLGLRLKDLKPEPPPAAVKKLIKERDKARELKDWGKADELRIEIEKLGFSVRDSEDGTRVKKR